METKKVTCPATGRVEELELERTPCGIVVAGCSHFTPTGAVTCDRACACLLDREDADREARQDRVLLVYAKHRWTHPVIEQLVELLRRDGLVVELADADSTTPPPPEDYDAIVIGTPQRFGVISRAVLDYIDSHIDSLEDMPGFFFTVGAATDAARLIARKTGWLPTRSRSIGRPPWYVRWFGDPDAARAPQVRELALVVGEETPS